MVRDILANGPAVVAWTAVAYRASILRRKPDDPAAKAYLLSLAALASALTVLAHPVYLTLDGMVGIPNLARFLGHGFIMVTSWAVQALLFSLNYPAAEARTMARRLGVALLVSLGFMAVLFSLAPVDEESLEFMSKYADVPFMLEYWLVFLSYLAVALINVMKLDFSYAARSENPSLKLGLWVGAVGAFIGLGYVGNEGVYVLGRNLGFGYPLGDKDMITTVLVASATSLMIIGSTMPGWGSRVGIPAIWGWVQRYRTLRELYPLWADLCRANPAIAMTPPPSPIADALNIHDVGFRLYRRVIEIRDGLLTLRPYVDPDVRDQARRLGREAGLSDTELTAVAEAAVIEAALRAKAQGRAVTHGAVIAANVGGADLGSEASFLAAVSHAYRRSPIVRNVVGWQQGTETVAGLVDQGAHRP